MESRPSGCYYFFTVMSKPLSIPPLYSLCLFIKGMGIIQLKARMTENRLSQQMRTNEKAR